MFSMDMLQRDDCEEFIGMFLDNYFAVFAGESFLYMFMNPLSVNSTKWSNIQTIRWLLPTNCLIVFDHFVGLTLKGLKNSSFRNYRRGHNAYLGPCETCIIELFCKNSWRVSAISKFFKKAPSKMFDKVVNTLINILRVNQWRHQKKCVYFT